MQNLNFTTTDNYRERFESFQHSYLFQRLQRKFTPLPYHLKFKALRIITMVASYLFNVFSALTAAALVYFFALELIGHWLPAGAVSVAALVILEASKRKTTATTFKDWLQFRNITGGMVAVVVLLSSLSVTSSYFGAKRVVEQFTPPPKLVSADSLTATIEAQVRQIDEQIAKHLANKNHRGEVYVRSLRTAENLTKQKTGLMAELIRTRQRADELNDGTSTAHTMRTSLKAEHFAAVTLLLELLFLLSAFYLEYYDYRSYLDFVGQAQESPPVDDIDGSDRTSINSNGQMSGITQAAPAAPATTGQMPPPPLPATIEESQRNGTHTPAEARTVVLGFRRPVDDTNAFRYNAMQKEAKTGKKNIEKELKIIEKDTALKPCQQCGKHYRPRTTWQKFCSDDCRLAYHAARHGQPFEPGGIWRKKKERTPAG